MILTLERVVGGYRVKTQAGMILEVRPMLRLFRLVELSVDHPRDIGRYWCYVSFEAAVLAGAAWDVDAATEPVGFIKSGGSSARQ